MNFSAPFITSAVLGPIDSSLIISLIMLITKQILDIQNLPVARGQKVSNVIDLLRVADEIGYPVVVKPQFGSKGKGVFVNIKSKKELVKVYDYLKDQFKDIIIEKFHDLSLYFQRN